MEFNLTDSVAKLFEDLIGGKWGRLSAKTYKQYYKPLNFAIVMGIGALLQMLLANIGLIAIVVYFAWMYFMTVGPLGKMWGFTTECIVVKEEPKLEPKKEAHEESPKKWVNAKIQVEE